MAQYLIYCDESGSNGRYFSNFYGGALVRSRDYQQVIGALEKRKTAEHLFQEVKWQKVTANYLAKYLSLMDLFFELVASDRVKVRIMFTQNINVPQGLTAEHRDDEYLILYYQFLKHAFGLRHSNEDGERISLRLFVDQMPATKEKVQRFKGYLAGLSSWRGFRDARILLRPDAISEVESHGHVLLQCLDIVVGAMHFRLNDHHKDIPAGKHRRGKRTVAKEALFKHISAKIRGIRAGFNIGVSTGFEQWSDRWSHPYRHWLFVPAESERDHDKAKKKK